MNSSIILSSAVAAGGAIGSVLRFATVQFIAETVDGEFPWGVATVNLVGSLLMGLLVGGLLSDPNENHLWRALLAVGILGGFTTFSAFSLDLVRLLDRGALLAALAYVCLSIFGGLAALLLGRFVAQNFSHWFIG
ncbi:MAG: fluoride efflux transporter CrcB [Alphaproteobacteria bacterium]|nr:fluoride efflux transporter CrcB [Alphaproteobacteria bacterium]